MRKKKEPLLSDEFLDRTSESLSNLFSGPYEENNQTSTDEAETDI